MFMTTRVYTNSVMARAPPLSLEEIEERMQTHLHWIDVRTVVDHVLAEGLRRYCARRVEEALADFCSLRRGVRTEDLRLRLVGLWVEVGDGGMQELWRKARALD